MINDNIFEMKSDGDLDGRAKFPTRVPVDDDERVEPWSGGGI